MNKKKASSNLIDKSREELNQRVIKNRLNEKKFQQQEKNNMIQKDNMLLLERLVEISKGKRVSYSLSKFLAPRRDTLTWSWT